MAQYMIVYLGGYHPSTPEEGQQHFVKFIAPTFMIQLIFPD